MSGVRALVGTRKGAFILTLDAKRADGFRQMMQRSDYGGKNWESFGNEFKYDGVPGTHIFYDGTQYPWEFKQVWHLEPDLTDADTVYAGIEDAWLFKSVDAGMTWQELPGLRERIPLILQAFRAFSAIGTRRNEFLRCQNECPSDTNPSLKDHKRS